MMFWWLNIPPSSLLHLSYSWTALAPKPVSPAACCIASPPEAVSIKKNTILKDILTEGTKTAVQACVSFTGPLTLYYVRLAQY